MDNNQGNPYNRTPKYSFILTPNNYPVLRAYRRGRIGLHNFKESMMDKLPQNLRIMKLTQFQKIGIAALFGFYLTTEVLDASY